MLPGARCSRASFSAALTPIPRQEARSSVPRRRQERRVRRREADRDHGGVTNPGFPSFTSDSKHVFWVATEVGEPYPVYRVFGDGKASPVKFTGDQPHNHGTWDPDGPSSVLFLVFEGGRGEAVRDLDRSGRDDRQRDRRGEGGARWRLLWPRAVARVKPLRIEIAGVRHPARRQSSDRSLPTRVIRVAPVRVGPTEGEEESLEARDSVRGGAHDLPRPPLGDRARPRSRPR